MAGAVVATGVLATNPLPMGMAVAKTSLDLPTVFMRAVLCNCERVHFLDCLSVASVCATDRKDICMFVIVDFSQPHTH